MSRTSIATSGSCCRAADIPVGARVVATVVSDSDFTAKTIEVGAVPAPSKSTR